MYVTNSLFSGDATALSAGDLDQLRQDGLPASALDEGALPETVTQLLTEAGLAASGKQVKDALQRGAVVVNGVAVSMEQNALPGEVFAPGKALFGRYHLVRLGKKKYHLFDRGGA